MCDTGQEVVFLRGLGKAALLQVFAVFLCVHFVFLGQRSG